MIEVDVWVRGTSEAATRQITGVPVDAATWTEADARALLTGMLRSIEREKNPGGEPPPVVLKGFSWIVSPEAGGVLVHLEMQLGTASAGPFVIAEQSLTDLIGRAIAGATSTVH